MNYEMCLSYKSQRKMVKNLRLEKGTYLLDGSLESTEHGEVGLVLVLLIFRQALVICFFERAENGFLRLVLFVQKLALSDVKLPVAAGDVLVALGVKH